MDIAYQRPILERGVERIERWPKKAPDGSPLDQFGRYVANPRAQRETRRRGPRSQIVGASLVFTAVSYGAMVGIILFTDFSLVGFVGGLMMALLGSSLMLAEILSLRSRGRTGRGALYRPDPPGLDGTR